MLLQVWLFIILAVLFLYFRLAGDGGTSIDKYSRERSLSVPNPTVTVSDCGLLQSYSTFGQAQIIIISTDEYGLKQTLSIAVEVKKFNHFLLSTKHIDCYKYNKDFL